MANLTQIQEGIVKTINELVGKDACVDQQLFTSPVIKSNASGNRPDFPFVTVGKVGLYPYGISGVGSTYFNDDGYLVHDTKYKASLIIQVRGNGEQNIETIAEEIRALFFRQYGLNILTTNTEAGLLGVSGVSLTYNYLNTDYEEVAVLNIDFSTTQTFIEDDPNCPSTGEIVTITQSGELDRHEDDQSPINVNTTVP